MNERGAGGRKSYQFCSYANVFEALHFLENKYGRVETLSVWSVRRWDLRERQSRVRIYLILVWWSLRLPHLTLARIQNAAIAYASFFFNSCFISLALILAHPTLQCFFFFFFFRITLDSFPIHHFYFHTLFFQRRTNLTANHLVANKISKYTGDWTSYWFDSNTSNKFCLNDSALRTCSHGPRMRKKGRKRLLGAATCTQWKEM